MAKDKWEEDAKDRFLQFLRDTQGETWNVLAEDVVVDQQTSRNFDYQLGNNAHRIALEIFRLVEDGEALARDRRWNEIVSALKPELERKGVKGYLIETPPHFFVSKPKQVKYVEDLACNLVQTINDNAATDEFQAGSFSFKRFEEMDEVVFAGSGIGGAVDPPGIALAALLDKLPAKNDQLSIPGHKRTILVVNWAYIVKTEDVVEACSQVDFDQFPNIDSMYFDTTAGRIELVFDRSLFNSFQSLDGPPKEELEPLFLHWLESRLTRSEPTAFALARKLANERRGVAWLPRYSRERVVRYADEFIKQGNWDDALWIIQTFSNDPDPPVENSPDDPRGEFNQHLRILKGERVGFITSVRGHLCWVLAQAIVGGRTDLYSEILNIVEKYAVGENLYIRQQATIPLLELCIRRRARKTDDEPLMTSELARRVRDLAFRMLRENTNAPQVLEGVGHVFVRMRDLNEAEALELLHTLLTNPTDRSAESSSLLLIYFALFRKHHFADLGPFDSEPFSALLREQLVAGGSDTRSHIMWRLWKLLDEEKGIEFKQVAPYIAILPDGSYDRSAFHHFYRILANHMQEDAKLLGPALRRAFQREKEFIQSNTGEAIWMLGDTRKSIEQLVEAGQIVCFLDCVEELLSYRDKMSMFPAERITELLRQAESRSKRATEILARF